jgi:hypothetical protein
MDPNEAWARLTDPGNDIEDQADGAAALVGWLKDGGFPPVHLDGIGTEAILALCAVKLAAAWEAR